MARPLMVCSAVAGLPFLVGVVLAGCSRSESAVISETVPLSLEHPADELRALQVMDYEPVEGLAGHRGKPFFVQSRDPALLQFPCSACHLEPLAVLPGPDEARTPTMHVDIRLQHAPDDIMDCATCHNPDSLDHLRSGTRTDIAFTHAYRLCAECHFQQVADWAGGAHGKRLAGWTGRRVVLGCSACHDPHAPAIAPQWPVAFPNLPSPTPERVHPILPTGAGHE